MNLLLWLLVGASSGWLASLALRVEAQQAALLNAVVGMLGAALGGWLLSPLLGPAARQVDAVGFAGALLGASLLLALFRLLRHRAVH